MPLFGATSETTTITEMQSRSEHIDLPSNSSLEENSYNSDDSSQQPQSMSLSTTASSTSPLDQTPSFDPSTCLFCAQTHSLLSESLSHMSTSHSFHIQTSNLQVETTTLLAHFHSVITDNNECLYCHKRFRSSSAAKQHMLHKGHCMFDVTVGKDVDVKEFYGLDAAEAELEGVKAELTARLEDHRVSKGRKKQPRSTAGAEASTHDSESRAFDGDGDGDDGDYDDRITYDDDAHLDTDASTPPLTSQQHQLIAPPISRAQARAQHQPSTFEHQLSHLRESDRRSIQHLPTSQQRALLATQFKQTESGGRAASARGGALESAGNSFGRLSSVRLVRIPPHSGRVQSLKH